MSETGDNVVQIAEAIDKALKQRGGRKSGRPPAPPPPPGGRPVHPPILPHDAPVKALGVNGREFYFVNCRDQFIAVTDKDIGRLAMLGMFGDVRYLTETWPKYARNGKTIINWDTGLVSEALVVSCSIKGIWSPEESVRGVGTWAELTAAGDSLLVMHCGDTLYLSNGMTDVPGLRGRLLYPAAPPQPHPEEGGGTVAGEILLDKLESWAWQRGSIDALLHLGWMFSALLGAAPEWRPIEWITGDSGSGKSTLMKLTRWVLGEHAMITSEDATAAGIKRRVANSALPVSLDEQESDGAGGNRKVQELIKLARIASSGGASVRGTPGADAISFVSRNCFQFSSIVIPSLPQQDKNRMFIGNLDALAPGQRGKSGDPDEADDGHDDILGARGEWERVGRRLRHRALAQWARYRKTLRAYRRALIEQGHSDRGADQFGALGAAADLALHDSFDEERARDFAAELPAGQLAETSGYARNHEACLMHLLGAPVESYKGGAKETVAQLLAGAREDLVDGRINNSTHQSALEGIGIKLIKDKRDRDNKVWWIAIANSHNQLARVFRETDWSGLPGAPGAWSQMMERVPGALARNDKGVRLKLRFQKVPTYCVLIPWEAAFAGEGASDDAEFGEADS